MKSTDIQPAPGIFLTRDEALARIVNFARSDTTLFKVYDVAGQRARGAHQLDEVDPWTFLLAGALAGRPTGLNLVAVLPRLNDFAELVGAVPPNRDLDRMDSDEREALINLCDFKVNGVGAAKTTKVAALYRHQAVPILDKRVAIAFGYPMKPRDNKIAAIGWLATQLADSRSLLEDIRSLARKYVVECGYLSLVRLNDILIWTATEPRLQAPIGNPPPEPEVARTALGPFHVPVIAHRPRREEEPSGPWEGRLEMALDTPLDLTMRPDWSPVGINAEDSEPISFESGGRRYTWFPGRRNRRAVITTPFASGEDLVRAEADCNRTLSALSFHTRQPISVLWWTTTGFRKEFERPMIHQPLLGRYKQQAPRRINVDSDAGLEHALALYREGVSTNTPALALVDFWNAIQVALGSTDEGDLTAWIEANVSRVLGQVQPDDPPPGDHEAWAARLRDTRNSAAHGLRSRAEGLVRNPDDLEPSRRVISDSGRLHDLARIAIEEGWSPPVRTST